MRDDFATIASEVFTASAMGVDIELCRVAVRDAWREIAERNLWSWLLRRGVTTLSAPYTTGLASFIQGFNIVAGSGTLWTGAMIGRQVRQSIGQPFYTIVDVPNAATLVLDMPWADSDAPATAYSIFSSYLTPPDDFFSFVVVKDPQRGWRLNLDVDQSVIDVYDPKRASTGQPMGLSPLDYAPSYAGKVSSAIQVVGSGGRPTASGSYLGALDALFTIQITGSGAIDVATYQWRKDENAWTPDTVSSSGNILGDGIGITWSAADSFTSGDVFVIRAVALSNPGLPRYEVYPYPSSQTVLHYQYIARAPDISDPGIVIPRFIPGHVIKEGALGRIARTPGSDSKPNPYAQIARAENHEERFQTFIAECMRQDEEVFCRSITQDIGLPFAPAPWAMMSGIPRDFDPAYIYPIYR